MKKIIALIFALLFIPCFCGCEKSQGLTLYLSEIRTDVLKGNSESYSLKANVYMAETPLLDDGKAGELTPYIKFFLNAEDLNAVYKIDFDIGEKRYSRDFSLDAFSGEFTATSEIEDTEIKTLTVNIVCAGRTETITLNSVIPENTLTYTEVLEKVALNNPDLFDAYKNENGEFLAEIRLKVTEKEGKPYYFFGIIDGNNKKAFLADGITAEVLAVRNVF